MHILSLRLVPSNEPTHRFHLCVTSFSPNGDDFLEFETTHLRANDYLTFPQVSILSLGKFLSGRYGLFLVTPEQR